MSDTSVFHKMEVVGMQLVNSIRKYHWEYFLAGVFIGVNKAPIGWALLGITCALPTIIILKNNEWFELLMNEKIEHIILFALIVIGINMYTVYCFWKSLGFN